MSHFKTSFLLKNNHIQTLYASLFRKKIPLKIDIETFTLQDGDFLECYWHNKSALNLSTPILILFHGLEGSYSSPYIQGLMQESAKNGFTSVLMHFRGCSGKTNNSEKAYHSCEISDATSWIKYLHSKYPNNKLVCVGYSMGGSMLLNLLAKTNLPISAAVTVSVPFMLAKSSTRVQKGFSQFYQWYLLRSLKVSLYKKFQKYPMKKLKLTAKKINSIKTFWEFDNLYTAPIHGFKDAKDYYTQCSARQYLKNINTPTLIIQSLDDPFMEKNIVPTQQELSSQIELEISQYGGHVGFVSGDFFHPKYWLEQRIMEYLKSKLFSLN